MLWFDNVNTSVGIQERTSLG